MSRFLTLSAGLVGVPIGCVVLRDRRSHHSTRSPDEVLSSPHACSCTRIYRLIRPAVFLMDPEDAHIAALIAGQTLGHLLYWKHQVQTKINAVIDAVAEWTVGAVNKPKIPSRLSITVNETTYRSPIGLSAGFDKNGKLFDFLSFSNLVAHAEIGSFSYYSWPGNPKPRVFRLVSDRAVINRMGLNNDGAEIVANRIAEKSHIELANTRFGVNITKTPDPAIEGSEAVADFVKSFDFVKNMNQINWVTLNISCPNTAEGKTFEDISALTELLANLRAVSAHKPLHLKVAPIAHNNPNWKEQAISIFETAKKFHVDAVVIANTVPDRNLGLVSGEDLLNQRGGLSGPPIFERSIPMIQEAFRHGLSVVGVGGVSSGKDAYKLMRSGASLIQLYTAMIYDGPTVFRDIENGLERELVINGYSSVDQVIGLDSNVRKI
jgi:dihydroorotate dehydrogenase